MNKIGMAFATAGIAASLYLGSNFLDGEMNSTPRYVNGLHQTKTEFVCEKAVCLGGFYLSLLGFTGSSIGLCYFLKEKE